MRQSEMATWPSGQDSMFSLMGPGSIPSQGSKILQASQHGLNK